ncbi:MAG: RNA-guided pseudouridylation complex pseudouridine synthase subunit Cbf5 [Nanoarchaeota archaeon]|nr:RNA-guided pseudouridylation complex pseudouridine synthase subunit Cbf5 [Nanoarchaeota archaeon]
MDIKNLLNGCFINIDKPEEPTSHSVDEWVMKILHVDKAGHFGTLDPMVTGVLPIAVGKATKLLQYLVSGKEYVGTMHFHEEVDLKTVEKAIQEKFLGTITQLPPVKSRVKRQEREREIYEFKILEHEGRDFLFYVKCEAGTYIRKLCHNLGEHLKIGAHMTELRRTRAGLFEEKDSITLNDLSEAYEYDMKSKIPSKLLKCLIPMEKVIKQNIKYVEVKKEALGKLKNGSPIFLEQLRKKPEDFELGEKVAVFCNDQLIEIAKVVYDGSIFAKPETVLI